MIVDKTVVSEKICTSIQDHVETVPNGNYKVVRESKEGKIIYIGLNTKDVKEKMAKDVFSEYIEENNPFSYLIICTELLSNVIVKG